MNESYQGGLKALNGMLRKFLLPQGRKVLGWSFASLDKAIKEVLESYTKYEDNLLFKI